MFFDGIIALFDKKVDSENAEPNTAHKSDQDDDQQSLALWGFEWLHPPLSKPGKFFSIDPVLEFKFCFLWVFIREHDDYVTARVDVNFVFCV